MDRALIRIAHEIVEETDGVENLAIVGIQRRGVQLAEKVAAEAAAGGGRCAQLEQRRQLLQQRRGAAGGLESGDRVGPIRSDRARDGYPPAQLVEQREHVELEPGLDRGGLQVFDAIDRAADREQRHDGVVKRCWGEDLTRPQILTDHVDDAAPRGAGQLEHPGTVREDGRGAR